ncbi:hypothetical protein B0F90DRAFT_397693 [Multifurca ochricompacta]|uniref:Uncharacterized protein n=1 Tax=Multifurca ochricompacta TaxID=376703 RepID=A0AAD4QKV0_9AGAM|nr:hypothetical protein B0F90DRAFT_397693 [Multifurca ochricompacta]
MMKHGALIPLPLELIDHTLSFLSWPTDLYPLLFVNKCLSLISERALYRNIGDLPAPSAVLLLLSLANAPAARCELVKALALDFSDNRVLFALELLIFKVLRLLPRLRALSVEVSIHENRHRALAWIFPRDAPFRLRSFATSIRLDPELAAFLESQPEICDLSLRGIPTYTSDPFTLPPSALPHLENFRSVHVDPDTLREVIGTRPVQGISLSLFSEHGYRALEVLARTSTPVRRLTILIVDASAPNELFPQLAARLPHLEALHIVALVQQYSLETLLASAPLLEAFAGLRFLTFMASGASCYELSDEATVAEHWARACPTLTTIILPKGRVWFASSAGRWVHS